MPARYSRKARPGDIAYSGTAPLKGMCLDCGLPGPPHAGFAECVLALRDRLGVLELLLAGERSRRRRLAMEQTRTGSQTSPP
jgi:hypothetical protein